MTRPSLEADAWKRLVLQAMEPPAWLGDDGPNRDIVLSTRVRYMRNLRGHRFPHHASAMELKEILDQVRRAPFKNVGLEFLVGATPAERDYLVACRLLSPDFAWSEPGRAVLLDSTRTVSIMVNEEDHLRIQALTPGWSFRAALRAAAHARDGIGMELAFARSERFGFLAASLSNAGAGVRFSAMFHLIGLAQTKRLPTVMRALNSQGLVVRGLFGERSRAIGAFVQVSSTSGSEPDFAGACEYLIQEESRSRGGVTVEAIQAKLAEAARFSESRQSAGLADALRVLAWHRWSSLTTGFSVREADRLLPEVALLESLGEPRAGRARVQLLRRVLRPMT